MNNDSRATTWSGRSKRRRHIVGAAAASVAALAALVAGPFSGTGHAGVTWRMAPPTTTAAPAPVAEPDAVDPDDDGGAQESAYSGVTW